MDSRPADMFRSTSRSMWCESSSTASRSSCAGRNNSRIRRRSAFIGLLRLGAQDTHHGRRGPLPRLLSGREPPPPAGGEAVIARATVVVRGGLRALDVSIALQPLQGRIERAEGDAEDAARHLLDALADAVAVQRRQRQRLEDEQIDSVEGHPPISYRFR